MTENKAMSHIINYVKVFQQSLHRACEKTRLITRSPL
ncbi:hypothetical protein EV194_101107 [Natronoflexus pectinivorans]|uniref:Uncharacterized protein n=1 Tax=Natronoflexus pectinivorans TaxID=682526 RepID=A0A4R2GN76_9BACT|nr:hypothetical protein EV194_101107 [Natronoflexus pectinivorans]